MRPKNLLLTLITTLVIAFTILAENPKVVASPSLQAEGQVYTPPYFNSLTTSTEFGDFKSVRSNLSEWFMTEEGECKLSGLGAMDAWLISPTIKLESGRYYTVSLEVKAETTGFNGSIEVKYGTTRDESNMDKECITPFEVTNQEFQTIRGDIFITSETGQFYFGIHGLSESGNSFLIIRNFFINQVDYTDYINTGFEEGESFSNEFAGWTFIDVDKSPAGQFISFDLPNITPGITPTSFFVFDTSYDNFSSTFDARSGDKFLASIYRYDKDAIDDWAISPLLSSIPQTISFWARSYYAESPESIEMYYSLGDKKISNFTQVGERISNVPSEWTKYEFDVPVGVKYFAIRSCGSNSFMLMLDDFKSRKIETNVLEPPFTHPLDTTGDFTIIDANSDNIYWNFYDGEGAYIFRNEYMAMDDWIISPAFRLESSKTYRFSCKACGNSYTSPEKLEIKYGNFPSVSGMRFPLVAETEIIGENREENYVELEGYITPEEEDVFYIGIHGIWDPDQATLFVKDFSLMEYHDLDVPRPVTDLEGVFSKDNLEGYVSFSLPDTLMNGVPAVGEVSYSIFCKESDGEELPTISGTASYGSVVEVPISVTVKGAYRFEVTLTNEVGESTSQKISVYIGDPGLPTLKGCVVDDDRWNGDWSEDPSDNNAVYGIYGVSDRDTELIFEGPNANFGGIRIDGFYYTFGYNQDGEEEFIKNTVYDLSNGAQITDATVSSETIFFGGLTLDPTTGKVYGIRINPETNSYLLSEVNINKDASVVVTTIADLEGCWTSLACDAQGQLYGISYKVDIQDDDLNISNSYLQKIDKETGATTLIGDTGKATQFSSSAVIDHESGRMFWNLYTPDKKGYLCEIKLETGEAVNLFRYTHNNHIMGMYVDTPLPQLDAVKLDRINRYLYISKASEESKVYWTDGEGVPDKEWGNDGDFYTGPYHDITSTFLRMKGDQTIRVMAKAPGMADSEIETVRFSEDSILVTPPTISFDNDILTAECDSDRYCVFAAIHGISFSGTPTNPANWKLDTKYAVFPPDSTAVYDLKVDTEGLWKDDNTYISLQNMQYHTVDDGRLPVHVLTFRNRPGQTLDLSSINPITLQDLTDDVTANVLEYGKAPVPKLEILNISIRDTTSNLPENSKIILSTTKMSTDGSERVLEERTDIFDKGFSLPLEEYNYKLHATAVAPNCISSIPSDTIYFTAADHKLPKPELIFDGIHLFAKSDMAGIETMIFDSAGNAVENFDPSTGISYPQGLRLGSYYALSSDSSNKFFVSERSEEKEIHAMYDANTESTRHTIVLDGRESLKILFSLDSVPSPESLSGTLALIGSITEENMDYLSDKGTSIHKLDLESLEWPNRIYSGKISDSIRTIRFGSNVDNLINFPTTSSVNEIEWNSVKSIPIPNSYLECNNHILRVPYGYEDNSTYSDPWGHIVRGLDSNNLQIDTLALNDAKAFYNSEVFKAKKAVYARKFTKETPSPYTVGGCAGWETIILPFDVESVVSDEKTFLPFGQGDQMTPHFWLYEATGNGWKLTESIKKGTPYLISFPLNEDYLPETMHNRDEDIFFIGNNVDVLATATYDITTAALPDGKYFEGNFILDSDNSIYALNEVEKDGYPAGSCFFRDVAVYPFRAGISGVSGQRMPVFGDWGQSGLQGLPDAPKEGMTVDAEGQRIVVRSLADRSVEIFDLTGALVERLSVRAGVPAYSHTLSPGIYLAAGRKILIR